MSKSLAAYFSASGVTAKLAATLARAAGADLYEIKPKVPYSEPDLDWNDNSSRSSIEMNDQTFRPAMAGPTVDVAPYDVIFVGFPIWWYVAPTIINTFLESCNLAGKTVVPFATSGSSGMGKTVEKLRPSAPGATFVDGEVFDSTTSEEALKAWIAKLRM